ncbi:ATP-binding cassette domain-containing protein [uncultured Sulfitobacter sp.]|uniref:ABC transporter ATP-binding protein n=1 Tax=uncultured Sulfitobacter sp. TaxID=191468 RepID=UPI0026274E32|nr:ATP-binding cassette domain-containing protein [uncultured Sulfitobacter sp.]
MVGPSVELREVCVTRRGKAILGPITLTLGGSGFTIVLGPNGAGKTTLLKVLHGVERVSSGTVAWSSGDAAARQEQAYVFQRPIMLRRSVRQNLAYPLQLLGMPKAEIAGKVVDWAARIGLEEMLDRPAPRLSGGEKQKLALGRALIRAPRVLFLDEPCANLDGRSTREIEAVLQAAHAGGTRIVMTTHDLGQARRLATDVVFVLNGRLHEQGGAPGVFEGPQTAEAAAFFQGDIVE